MCFDFSQEADMAGSEMVCYVCSFYALNNYFSYLLWYS